MLDDIIAYAAFVTWAFVIYFSFKAFLNFIV